MSATHSVLAPRRHAAAWLAVAVVLVAPVWLVDIPPLSDFYNHLARLHIIAHHGESPTLQTFYAVTPRLVPNLAVELVGLPLLSVFSLAVTAKLVISFAVLLWHLGCDRLARAIHGRPTRRALICSFFVYNQQLLHGYISFIISMGLCLLVLAFWLERGPGSRPPPDAAGQSSARGFGPIGAVLAILAGLLVFVAHLSGFATLALAIAAMTVVRAVRMRRIDHHAIVGMLPLIPGTVLFFIGFLSMTGTGGEILLAPIADNARDSLSILTGYHPVVDAVSIAAAALVVVVALALGVWRNASERADDEQAADERAGRARGLLARGDVVAAGLVLGAAFWLCPSDIATGIEVNARFLLGAFTLTALAVDLHLSARKRTAIAAVVIGLFVARTAVTAVYWIRLDREFAAQRRAFAAIERGAAVHNITFYPTPRLLNADRVRGLALIHAPCFAAVDREANVPTLYALPGQQPLEHRESLYRAHRFPLGSRPDIDWPRVFSQYRYVWTCRAPLDLIDPLARRGRVLATVGVCTLYELPARDAEPAEPADAEPADAEPAEPANAEPAEPPAAPPDAGPDAAGR